MKSPMEADGDLSQRLKRQGFKAAFTCAFDPFRDADSPARNDIIAQMPLNPHQSVDHYEIIALIGSGGMGEVYRARDTRLNRDVAIKVLPGLSTADVRPAAQV